MTAQVEIDAPASENGQGRSSEMGSLAERIQKRREELAQYSTVTLPVEGYEDFLAVEYRAIPWQQTRRIVGRHQRLRDEGLQQLYVAADTLIEACEMVYEVKEDGSRVPLNHPNVWGAGLARRLGWEVPENATDRQAMLSYIFAEHDTWLMSHYGSYAQWLQGETQDEVLEDLERTP